jgi:hypothetical protein
MPDPRPDIRCVQYLPKVHHKMPIEFLASNGTPGTPEVYTSKQDVEQRSTTSLHADMDPPHHHDVE